MNSFRDFISFELAIDDLITDQVKRQDFKNIFYQLREGLNDKGTEFLNQVFKEAKAEWETERPSLYRNKRYLSPEESELYQRYRSSGLSGQESYIRLMADKGQLPAVKAWISALGLEPGQENLSKIRKGETDDVKMNLATSKNVRKKMQSQGMQILPDPQWKEMLEKQVLKNIRDKSKTGYALNPKEQKIYKVWKSIVSSKQIVGNRAGYQSLDAPADAIKPKDYDNLWMRLRNPGYSQPNASNIKSLKSQMANPQSHLSHYDPLLENNDKLYPDEIALNIDDAWEAISKKIEILTQEEAELMYLDKIKNDILTGRAFMPNADTKDQSRRYGRWDQTLTGTAGASTGISNPVTNPGDLQVLTGKVRDIQNKKFSDLKTWGKQPADGKRLKYAQMSSDLPAQYISLNKERTAFPDEKINNMYKNNPKAFQSEVLNVAQRAAEMYGRKDPNLDIQDMTHQIAMAMMQATGLDGWREREDLRFKWAKLYAWRLKDKLDNLSNQVNLKSNKPYTNKQSKEIKTNVFNIINNQSGLERMGLSPEEIEILQKSSNNLKQAIMTQDRNLAMKSIGRLLRISDDYPELGQIINMMLNPA